MAKIFKDYWGPAIILEAPFLIAIDQIAAFVGRSPVEVQQELARAGIFPVVNSKPVHPLIGYDPYPLEGWLSTTFFGPATAGHGGALRPSGGPGTKPNVFGTFDGWGRPDCASELPDT